MNKTFVQSIALATLCAGFAAAGSVNAPAENIRPAAKAEQFVKPAASAPILAEGIALPGLFEKMRLIIGWPPGPRPAQPSSAKA